MLNNDGRCPDRLSQARPYHRGLIDPISDFGGDSHRGRADIKLSTASQLAFTKSYLVSWHLCTHLWAPKVHQSFGKCDLVQSLVLTSYLPFVGLAQP